MQLDDPFPLDLFPPRVRDTILDEFQGRHPTTMEVAQVSDARWLGSPRIGPSMLAKIRGVTRGRHHGMYGVRTSALTDAELLAQLQALQGELERIRGEIKVRTAELWTRGIVPPTMAMKQVPKSSTKEPHQATG
jgi:hypothetical protein